MNKGKVHKNIKHSWRTPDHIFEPLNQIFKFDLDLMATAEDTKLEDYIPKLEDIDPKDLQGLSIWVNPPYGRDLYWVMPIIVAIAQHADYTVCLLPASFDLEWYHKYVLRIAHHFVRRGRIQFDPPIGVELKRNAPSHENLLAIFTGPFANDMGYLRHLLEDVTEWREITPPDYFNDNR